MLTETGLIPFSCTILAEKSWLIFAPHPDDETIGMGGALLAAKESACSITIVFMTNGDQGGDASIRRSESQTVAKILNAKTIYLNFPDRGIEINSDTISLCADVISEIDPEAVFFPSPEEFHPDHRATAALVWRAQQISGYKNSLYHYEISRQGEANILVDITSQAAAKRDLLNCYESQVWQNNYISVVDAINTARTYTLPASVERAEAFFKYSHNSAVLSGVLKERGFICLGGALPYEWPIISVLVRTKDRPVLLSRALDSLKAQIYRNHMDVVVVNDGGCTISDVVEKYRGEFWRLEVVDIPVCRGRAAAANVALIHAQGRFINFLDDDDEFDPIHLQAFIGSWRRNNDIEVFYRGVRVLSDAGEKIRDYNEPYDPSFLVYANYIPIHAVTFSRRFVDIGCRFDESLEFFEDWDFWIQLSRLTKFYRDTRITATYHMVGDSAASPHMHKVMDHTALMNKVRAKWFPKLSMTENNLVIHAVSARAKK